MSPLSRSVRDTLELCQLSQLRCPHSRQYATQTNSHATTPQTLQNQVCQVLYCVVFCCAVMNCLCIILYCTVLYCQRKGALALHRNIQILHPNTQIFPSNIRIYSFQYLDITPNIQIYVCNAPLVYFPLPTRRSWV